MNDRGQFGLFALFAVMLALFVVGVILVFGTQIAGAIFDTYTVSGAFASEAASHEADTGGRLVMGGAGLVLAGLVGVAVYLYTSGRARPQRPVRRVRRRF